MSDYPYYWLAPTELWFKHGLRRPVVGKKLIGAIESNDGVNWRNAK